MVVRATVCGALLVLSGCFIPKLRPAQTGMSLPASYNGSPNGSSGASINGQSGAANSGLLRVDEFYTDPILVRLICQSMATNRELGMLNEEIQVARAQVLAKRGAFLPIVGLRLGAESHRLSTYTLEGASLHNEPYVPAKFFPNPLSNYLLGFNFGIPLDIWRELRNARDAAAQRYFAAVEQRNAFMTRLVADVAENYYGLMALDQRIVVLNQIIAFQENSLKVANDLFNAGGRGTTALAIQRFQAEVRKNQSEKLIVSQEIVEVENRINFLVGRLPQPVERSTVGFYDLTIHSLDLGVPSQLLRNRPDIRQAERELAAAGLDVQVARARFFPRVDITAGIGYAAFQPRYIFMPETLVFNAIGELVAPILNKAAIRADYLSANARQIESVYNYQQVIIQATTDLINRLSKVQNFSKSIVLKNQQLDALFASINFASQLFQNARTDYLQVLFAQRDYLTAKTVLIDTKRQQLSAIVNVYQALGGGTALQCPPPGQEHPPTAQPQPDPQKLDQPKQMNMPPMKIDPNKPNDLLTPKDLMTPKDLLTPQPDTLPKSNTLPMSGDPLKPGASTESNALPKSNTLPMSGDPLKPGASTESNALPQPVALPGVNEASTANEPVPVLGPLSLPEPPRESRKP